MNICNSIFNFENSGKNNSVEILQKHFNLGYVYLREICILHYEDNEGLLSTSSLIIPDFFKLTTQTSELSNDIELQKNYEEKLIKTLINGFVNFRNEDLKLQLGEKIKELNEVNVFRDINSLMIYLGKKVIYKKHDIKVKNNGNTLKVYDNVLKNYDYSK